MDMFKDFFNDDFFNKFFNLDLNKNGEWTEKEFKTPNGKIYYKVYVSNPEEVSEPKQDDKLKSLQLELDKAVELEDYLKAAELKKKIDSYKENESKINELRSQLKLAVEKEDYLKAAELKKEIESIK